MTSLRSPLHDQHVALGATLADFGGWQMPIEYAGTVSEHTAVREAVGIFDVSHMGKVRVHGPGALAFLNSMLTNDLGRIGAGQAQYTMLCAEDGGVVDDLLVYRWSDEELFCIPNAANSAEVVRILTQAAPAGVEVDDHQADHGIIAIQGPSSAAVLDALGLPSAMPYMAMLSADIDGSPVIVARSGYTGEHGYELVVPVAILERMWRDALAVAEPVGGVPAGLGARDTLRLEMGYPLHGHELSLDISPLEAGAGWAVGWDKGGFRGADALAAQRAQGAPRRLRGLLALERGIPRADLPVFAGDHQVGITTSGGFSPTRREGIALALLDPSVAEGDEVEVDVRGRRLRTRVTRPPFVEASPR